MLLDLLFPKYCLECRRPGKYVCNECLAKVEIARPICPVCKRASFGGVTHSYCKSGFSLDGLVSAYRYEGVIRKAILALKYRFAYDIARELAGLIQPSFNNAVFLPVPLYPSRERWRGFNQAGIMAKLLAKKGKSEYQESAVLRLGNTTPQVKLGKAERLQNIRGKFAVNETFVPDGCKKYIIFDDVWTTGATISEIGKVLKKAGAKEVWGMSVART